jgi:hypothetical protein
VRSINTLAAELVVDRTALGRNIRSLERDGLIAIESDPSDGPSKILPPTKGTAKRVSSALKSTGRRRKSVSSVRTFLREHTQLVGPRGASSRSSRLLSRTGRRSRPAKRVSRTPAATIASVVMHPLQACVAVQHALTNVYMRSVRCICAGMDKLDRGMTGTAGAI